MHLICNLNKKYRNICNPRIQHSNLILVSLVCMLQQPHEPLQLTDMAKNLEFVNNSDQLRP